MAAADPQWRIEILEAALRTASRELYWANLNDPEEGRRD